MSCFLFRLTKLEVITHVIDYIRDLRQTLGLPPCIAEQGVATTPFDVQSAMIMSQAANTNDSATDSTTSAPITSSTTLPHPLYRHHHQRQPLCVITNPNGNAISTTPEVSWVIRYLFFFYKLKENGQVDTIEI